MTSSSRTAQFLLSLIITYFGQLATLLGSFLITPFLLARLGSEEVGRWLITLQILGYLTLVDFGVATTLGRRLGAVLTPEKRGAAAKLVESAMGLVAVQLPVVLVASAALLASARYRNQPNLDLLLVVTGTFFVTFPTRTLREVIRANHDLAFLGTIQATAALLTLGAQFAIVLSTSLGATGLALGWALGELLIAVACVLRVARVHRDLFPQTLILPGKRNALSVSESGWLFVQQVAQLLVVGTDLLIVGWMLGPAAATSYAITNRLFATFSSYPQQILLAATPALVSVAAEKGSEMMGQRITVLMAVAGWVTIAISSAILACNPTFIAAWVGTKYFAGTATNVFFALTALLRVLRLGPGIGLFAIGRQRSISLIAIASGIFGVGASILLGRQFGLAGVAAGSLLGVMCIEVPAIFYLYAPAVRSSLAQVLRNLLPLIATATAAWGVSLLTSRWDWRGTLVGAAMAAAIALACLIPLSIPLFLTSSVRDELTSRVKHVGYRLSARLGRTR